MSAIRRHESARRTAKSETRAPQSEIRNRVDVMTQGLVGLLVVGFFLVPLLGIVLGLDWVAVGRLADAVEAEVASRVRLLTEGPPPRAGDDAVVEEVEREPRLGLSTRDR